MVFGVCGSLLFIYIAFRAYAMGMTHDEAYSFFLVHTNYLKALGATANTHWLNSLGLKIADLFDLHQPLFLRWHSVFAFALYAFFVYKLSAFLKSYAAIVLMLALFFFNLFTLEYFSLARGYGLAFCFLMGSIYFACKIIANNEVKEKDFLGAFALGTLAVASNYTTLFQFAALSLFLFGVLYRQTKDVGIFFKAKWKYATLLFLITCGVATTNLLLIKFITDDLHFGGDHSFVSETMNGIWAFMLYLPMEGAWTSTWSVYFTSFSVLVLLAMIAILVWGIVQKKWLLVFPTFLFWFHFALCELTHFLFATPFPYFRTALVLFAGMALSFVFWVDQWNVSDKLKTSLVSMLAVSMLTYLVMTTPLTRSYEWIKHSETEDVLNSVLQASDKSVQDIKILCDDGVYPIWKNYYSQLETDPFPMQYDIYYDLNKMDSDEERLNKIRQYDFVICRTRNVLPVLQSSKGIQELKSFEQSGILIFEVPFPSTSSGNAK